jgi:hypothetical protein
VCDTAPCLTYHRLPYLANHIRSTDRFRTLCLNSTEQPPSRSRCLAFYLWPPAPLLPWLGVLPHGRLSTGPTASALASDLTNLHIYAEPPRHDNDFCTKPYRAAHLPLARFPLYLPLPPRDTRLAVSSPWVNINDASPPRHPSMDNSQTTPVQTPFAMSEPR